MTDTTKQRQVIVYIILFLSSVLPVPIVSLMIVWLR